MQHERSVRQCQRLNSRKAEGLSARATNLRILCELGVAHTEYGGDDLEEGLRFRISDLEVSEGLPHVLEISLETAHVN